MGDQELPPLAPHPQVPATSEQQLDIAERRDHHDVSSSTVAPSNRRRNCLPAWNVSMPLSINLEALRIGRFTSTTVKPHSKFFTLTPEVYGPRTVVFQQLSRRRLERGTWPILQCSVSEVVRPTDMLGCPCVHQKLNKFTFSHSCIIRSHHQFTEPARLRVSLHQRGDRIVPVVDCAVPAENKPGGGGVTRVVLLLALLFGGSTDSSSSTSAIVFLIDSLFACVPTFHSDHNSLQT